MSNIMQHGSTSPLTPSDELVEEIRAIYDQLDDERRRDLEEHAGRLLDEQAAGVCPWPEVAFGAETAQRFRQMVGEAVGPGTLCLHGPDEACPFTIARG